MLDYETLKLIWWGLVGVLLIGMVLNGMDLLNISAYYQQGVQGLILVFAVLLNRWRSD